ncbi:phenylalanine--tRNA ligase subunit beta [bacterium]|nr:phenylalanine--tRNA ligase subunit beta [bacterium]
MRISYTWLKELLGIDCTPGQLADILTRLGMAVDALEHFGAPYDKVVVGEVLDVAKHPQADKLSVCMVNVGAETLQIVCGAPNVAVGQHVPVACIGAKLGGDLVIKKSKLRGVESFGMCCAADELGISGDHEGLLVLGPATPVGTPFESLVHGEDWLFELDTANNRPDLLSHIGVAREIAAYRAVVEQSGKPFALPAIPFVETQEAAAKRVTVSIADRELCPRYAARLVEGIAIGPSPLWMQARLYRLGMRPINNIVDITNYVLLEYGHPLHAFDFACIAGGGIIVRRAHDGEAMTTLDGAERKLDADMLVIADREKAVALAGVMGGANSEVTDRTNAVLIESAYFNGPNIRRTVKRLGLASQASMRFERGVRGVAIEACNRAAQLMHDLAGGTVLKGIVDECHVQPPAKVSFSLSRCKGLLGREVTADEATAVLGALGFGVARAGTGALDVTVAGHRVDVSEWNDLAEDCARVLGYDTIPTVVETHLVESVALAPIERIRREVTSILSGAGLMEACNPSMVSPAQLDAVGLPAAAPERTAAMLANPSSFDQSIMRPLLYPGLVENLRLNIAQGAKSVRLFEVGREYRPVNGDGRTFSERETLGMLLWGDKLGKGWWGDEMAFDIHDGIGVLQLMLRRLGATAKMKPAEARDGFHPGRMASVECAADGAVHTVGWIGELDPRLLRALDAPGRAVVAELDLAGVVKASSALRSYKPLPRYPAATRDVSFVIADEVSHANVLDAVASARASFLERTELFDIYRGEQIGAGKKSVAYRMTYRAPDRTLTDEEIDKAHQAVVRALQEKLSAQVR